MLGTQGRHRFSWLLFAAVAVAMAGAAHAEGDTGGATLDVVSVRADTWVAPHALAAPPATRYPATALSWRREGRAVVAVHIGADGSVAAATLRESSGDTSLDRAALSLVKERRFAPATLHGEPIASDARIPVSFDLAQAR